MRKNTILFVILLFIFSFAYINIVNATDILPSDEIVNNRNILKEYKENDIVILTIYEKDGTIYYESLNDLEGFFTSEGDTYYLYKDTKKVAIGLKTISKKKYYFKKDGLLYKGWLKLSGKQYYFSSDGSMELYLGYIDGKTYYFGSNGVQKTGWRTVSKKKYYFDPVEKYAVTGWQVFDKDLYYFKPDGAMQRYFGTIDGKTYYFGLSGKMRYGWQDIDGKTYRFNKKTGEMFTGWKVLNDKTYYFNQSGSMEKYFGTIDGKTYYFGSDGVVKYGWRTINKKTYHFNNSSGVMAVGFRKFGKKTYFFNNSGVNKTGLVNDGEYYYYLKNYKLVTSSWKTVNNNKYYFNKSGKALTGLVTLSGKKYYFNSEAKMVKSKWITVGDKTYYFNKLGTSVSGNVTIKKTKYSFTEDGILESGFYTKDGKKYYHDANNVNLTGWQWIEGKKYFINKYGVILKENAKKVIDVSAWQSTIDWEKVKSKGDIDGVILRIGYTASSTASKKIDSTFVRNVRELNRLNIPYGVYYYGLGRSKTRGINEANFVIETLNKYNASLSYPVFYDAEVNKTVDVWERTITAFATTIINAGYEVGVYGNLSALSSGYLNSDVIKQYNTWVAQYYHVCNYKDDYVGWQYTSSGSIPGIEGRVDISVWN